MMCGNLLGCDKQLSNFLQLQQKVLKGSAYLQQNYDTARVEQVDGQAETHQFRAASPVILKSSGYRSCLDRSMVSCRPAYSETKASTLQNGTRL